MATEITYEVKTHEERFTDIEIALRRELEAHLPERLRNYTTPEALDSLKEYRKTSETFYPENHFYVFDNSGDLLGFTHLWPQYSGEDNSEVEDIATMTLPFVKDGDTEVEKALHNALLQKAKSLGVKKLRITADSDDQELLDRLDEYGFTYEELNRLNSILPLDKLHGSYKDGIEVHSFSEEEHGEPVLEAYEALGHNVENIKNQFNWLSEAGDRLISWKVAFQDTKLVGQGVAFLYTEGGTRAQLNVVTRGIDSDDQTYENAVSSIFASHLESLEASSANEVELNILPNALETRPLYEGLGFNFNQSDSYITDLE